MNRREFVAAAGTLTMAMAAGEALAQADHASHAGHAAGAGARYHHLEETSAHCVMTGQDCLRHCLDTFAAGDTTLAACAKSVRELVAVCAALQDLAVANSLYVPALAKVVLTVCTDCEKECRKHADHHAECKACADACKDCAEECRKLNA